MPSVPKTLVVSCVNESAVYVVPSNRSDYERFRGTLLGTFDIQECSSAVLDAYIDIDNSDLLIFYVHPSFITNPDLLSWVLNLSGYAFNASKLILTYAPGEVTERVLSVLLHNSVGVTTDETELADAVALLKSVFDSPAQDSALALAKIQSKYKYGGSGA